MSKRATPSVSETAQTAATSLITDGLAALTNDLSTTAGQPLPGLDFTTGLATTPQALPRRFLGLAAPLLVPPGTSAVVHLPGGIRRVYEPGSYQLWSQTPGTVLVQWVDRRRRPVPVGPIEGWSADHWRIRYWVVVTIEVADPAAVAAQTTPLHGLAAAVRTGVLRYLEQHPAAALTGCDGAAGGGLDAPGASLLARLTADPALNALRIVSVQVVEREGDTRQIEAMTTATVAAAEIDESTRVSAAQHRARLQTLTIQATEAEVEHRARLASITAEARERLMAQEADVQRATLAAELDLLRARIAAQTAEIAHDEQRWQAEQARLAGEWQRLQTQLLGTHQTDQQVRLLEAEGTRRLSEAELVLALEERHQAHTLALAEVQSRLAAQQTAQAEAMAERRAHHEQTLVELRLRHEQVVAEHLQRLEQWRAETVRVEIDGARQHDRQLAAIAGTAQIAAAAASQATEPDRDPSRPAVASAGLRALQSLAETPPAGEE